ncbi:MAG TPA: hypothetical protein DD490_30295 [Acidobacteria bacterium]|nr:hypothetical protein [Acidobacteriota bacterium]
MNATLAAPETAPPAVAPWWIEEEAFPADEDDESKLAWLLHRTILAPAELPPQAWTFRLENDTLELYADRSSGLPGGEPDGRVQALEGGAALFHLWLALRHHGYAGDVELLPEIGRPDLLARVQLGEMRPALAEEELLFAQIRRHPARRGASPGTFSPRLIADLQAAAAEEGAWLQVLDDPEIRRVCAMKSPAALLAVLGTEEDDVLAWLEAGEALARVQLRARREGVEVSPVRPAADGPERRLALRRALGRSGHPQRILRLR